MADNEQKRMPAPAFEPQPPGGRAPTPPQDFEAPAQGGGLALGALICGLVSMLACVPAAIAGIALGVLALRGGGGKGRQQVRNRAAAGIALSVLGLVVAVVLAGAWWAGMSRLMSPLSSGSRLRQIHYGLQAYAGANNARMPEHLEDLCPDHVTPDVLLVPGDPAPLRTTRGFLASHEYVGPLNCRDIGVIIVCEPARTAGNKRAALTVGGEVLTLAPGEFRKRMLDSLSKVMAEGWNDYPEERRAEITDFYSKD